MLKLAFVNRLNVRNQGTNDAFAPHTDASYRNPNGVIELEYSRPTATTDCRLEVFVFTGPIILTPFSKSGSAPTQNVAPATEVIYSKSLGRVGTKRIFQLPVAEFSPVFRPIPKSASAGSLGGGAAIQFNPNAFSLSGMKSLGAGKPRKTGFAKQLLDAGVPVTFFLRIVDAQGVESSVAHVTVGEPMPPATVRTLLEANTVRATPEFPEERYGQEITLSGEADRKFRFRAFGPYSQAVFQVSPLPFDNDPRKWREDRFNLIRQWAAIPKAAPNQPATEFWGRLAKLPSPTKTDQKFYARLILLDDFGALAALPSNPITITVPKVQTPPPPKESWMEFNIEPEGWEPGHLATSTDAYRFILNKMPSGKMKEHVQKVTGKSNLALGDKLYLPPVPPADKTWWESVKESVAEILDTLSTVFYTVTGVISMFASMFITVMNMIPKAFLVTIPKDLGLDTQGIEAGLEIASYAQGVANYPMELNRKMESSASFYADSILESSGLTPNQRLAARGQVIAAVSNWAKENKPWNGKFFPDMLIPDPDWVPRPATVRLRVTSVGKGKPDPSLLVKPPTVEIKVRALSKNSELLGLNAEWRDVFQKTLSLPQMGPNETSTVSVVLDYHWSQSAQPEIWTNAMNYAQKVMVTINGKSYEFPSGSSN